MTSDFSQHLKVIFIYNPSKIILIWLYLTGT
jgi:hypothetical protein